MGARLWYRSCPAVSQISNFTVVSSRHTDWARNAAVHKGGKMTGYHFATPSITALDFAPPQFSYRQFTNFSYYLLWLFPGTHQIGPWQNAEPGWTFLQPCHPAAPTWTGRSWSVVVCRWSGLHSLWSSWWPVWEMAGGLGLLPGVEHLHCLPKRV